MTRARHQTEETLPSPTDWDAERSQPIALIEALSRARACAAELTGMPVDGISASEPDGAGGWRVTVEVVEGAARIGENDLLAAYRVEIGAEGALTGYARIRRYRREEGGAG